jgi:hypothetical protein
MFEIYCCCCCCHSGGCHTSFPLSSCTILSCYHTRSKSRSKFIEKNPAIRPPVPRQVQQQAVILVVIVAAAALGSSSSQKQMNVAGRAGASTSAPRTFGNGTVSARLISLPFILLFHSVALTCDLCAYRMRRRELMTAAAPLAIGLATARGPAVTARVAQCPRGSGRAPLHVAVVVIQATCACQEAKARQKC